MYFVKEFNIHQRRRIKSLKNRPYHCRISADCSPIESLLVVAKFMFKGFDDFKCLLVATAEILNFEVKVFIKTKAAKVVAKASIDRVICVFSLLHFLNRDLAFMER